METIELSETSRPLVSTSTQELFATVLISFIGEIPDCIILGFSEGKVTESDTTSRLVGRLTTGFLSMKSLLVGAESDQHVNIYSFAVRCDRMWPSTQ